jgi:RND family efflux transporter MFP subunit
MKQTTVARLFLLIIVTAGFAAAGWQLLASAPESKRQRPAAPVPLVDVVDSAAASHALTLEASGPVVSAFELDIRPQVGGLITELHPDFEPGGRIPAGQLILRIEPADYRLAVAAAEADIAKARAAIALEQGRRVVAREELKSLQGTLKVDPNSTALALRKPQLRQVEAELAAAQNRLRQAELDLARTEMRLPFDVIVLERDRVNGEVVAARELVGRVTRADEYWVELRIQPEQLHLLRARSAAGPGSAVTVHEGAIEHPGEVARIRADLAEGSRLGGVIAALPVDTTPQHRLLIGQYVEATIDAGTMDGVVAVPRRAVRDNRRVWVVDAEERLQIRRATVRWSSGQTLLIASSDLESGDRVVISRLVGLVPGTQVRSRTIEPGGSPLTENDEVAGRG